jgi:hypothetical protein
MIVRATRVRRNGLDQVRKSADEIQRSNLRQSENLQVVEVRMRKMNQLSLESENQRAREDGEWTRRDIVLVGELKSFDLCRTQRRRSIQGQHVPAHNKFCYIATG